MKKLSKKGKVRPSSSPTLSYIPATILTLAAALSPEDKEVLAYLISCCGSTNDITADDYKTTHESFGCTDCEYVPLFDCNCFRCYKSFWARWDTSPNRHLIHKILEAYEEGLFRENNRSLKKKKKKKKRVCDEFKNGESGSPEMISSGGGAASAAEGVDDGGDNGENVEMEKGSSVTKIVNFLGERIWNFWSIN